jgi:hypothetical protein
MKEDLLDNPITDYLKGNQFLIDFQDGVAQATLLLGKCKAHLQQVGITDKKYLKFDSKKLKSIWVDDLGWPKPEKNGIMFYRRPDKMYEKTEEKTEAK